MFSSSRGRPADRPADRGTPPLTMVDKVWDTHRRAAGPGPGHLDELVVDRILLHEHQVCLLDRTGVAGRLVPEPGRVVACADQQLPTVPTGDEPRPGAQLAATMDRLERASATLGLPLFGLGDARRGLVNVVAAEQGLVLPGQLVVGADAHVSTLGALGAMALTCTDREIPELVDTGHIHRARPGSIRIRVGGRADSSTAAKDLALWLLGRLWPGGVAGRVVELEGRAIRELSVEGRMTVCNLLAETGALTTMIAPDARVAQYLGGRAFSPQGPAWDDVVGGWPLLDSEAGAGREADLVLLCDGVGPHLSWGTEPWQVAPLAGVVPHPDRRHPRRGDADERALADQGLVAGTPFTEIPIDQVFIGSCANARIEDLRAAARVARAGRAQVPAWVVPGSWPVKRQAEHEGLHHIFRAAGFEWRDPGCSLCIGANGDSVAPGTRLVSTGNRAARGHVGPGARTHLVSPETAAATAITGRLTPAH